jgi:hypothetical protein
MFNTKATNTLKDKTVTINSDMFVEHWEVVEATGLPNKRISEL